MAPCVGSVMSLRATSWETEALPTFPWAHDQTRSNSDRLVERTQAAFLQRWRLAAPRTLPHSVVNESEGECDAFLVATHDRRAMDDRHRVHPGCRKSATADRHHHRFASTDP